MISGFEYLHKLCTPVDGNGDADFLEESLESLGDDEGGISPVELSSGHQGEDTLEYSGGEQGEDTLEDHSLEEETSSGVSIVIGESGNF